MKALLFILITATGLWAQGRAGQAPAGPPPTPRAAAPIDLTGQWVSMIVDEWRFRVVPQKGDLPYLPLNAEARRIANTWDPAKDETEGNACKAYGAVGVMQRPGRVRIAWENDTTLKVEFDAGTQTRALKFGAAPAEKGAPSWQGYSTAEWIVNGRPLLNLGLPNLNVRGGGPQSTRGGTLKVTTTNMKPGYLRKNGVPYSDRGVMTEYFNLVEGAQGEKYFAVTAMLDDPAYLNQPFIRTYTFKKESGTAGWEPTPCWNQ